MKIITNNFSQTKKLGNILAEEILKTPLSKKAFMLGLEGNLGGGKTTFLQGFARGLGIKQRILSPTFVIARRYKIPRRRASSLRGRQNTIYKIQDFYHIDCYRIKKPKEILDLRFKEIISNPENIVAIEWADRICQIIPKETFWIKFEIINKNQRKIMLKY